MWRPGGVSIAAAFVVLISCDQSTAPEPTGAITVCVVSSFWDQAIPADGVVVRITAVTGELSRSAATNARGERRFSGLPPGSYRVELMDDGRFDALDPVEVPLGEDASIDVEIHVDRVAGQLAGVVLNRFSGGPFAEAVSVRVTPLGSPDVVATITAKPDGSFQGELTWGEYELELDAGGEAIVDPALTVARIGPGIGDELEVAALPILDDDVLVDFETPQLEPGVGGEVIDPLELGELHFVAEAEQGGGFLPVIVPVVGIVRNWGTSACIDTPDEKEQLLATGVDESIGFSGFDVRVDLPGWLPAESRVAVTIQSDATWSGRVSLIDHAGGVVQEASEPLGPVVGACVEGRVPIGASEVAVSSPGGEWVASVRVTVFGDPGPAGGGRVWVADDFEIDVPDP